MPLLHLLSKQSPAAANQAKSLIITPTRELAIQVAASVEAYGQFLPIKSCVVYGGVKINPQMMKLRKGVDILVATPGRLLDLYQQKAVKFEQLEMLILDEADRMLDMGFIRDIKKIIALLPKQRQTMLFSATFSDSIRQLAKGLMHQAVEISTTPRNTTVKAIAQWVFPVDKKQKSAMLSYLVGNNNWQQVLVFTRTKHGANRLVKHLLADGISSLAIHGNKSQGARVKALSAFKDNKIQVLVATDIAARGIDIHELPHVVNFDLPNVAEDYVHRIGRTGRAGSSGEAISLVSADEFKQLSDIERLIQKSIPRKLIDGFEPNHDVPASRTTALPVKKKKPKKKKYPNAKLDESANNDAAKSDGSNNSRPNSSRPNSAHPNNRRGKHKSNNRRRSSRNVKTTP